MSLDNISVSKILSQWIRKCNIDERDRSSLSAEASEFDPSDGNVLFTILLKDKHGAGALEVEVASKQLNVAVHSSSPDHLRVTSLQHKVELGFYHFFEPYEGLILLDAVLGSLAELID